MSETESLRVSDLPDEVKHAINLVKKGKFLLLTIDDKGEIRPIFKGLNNMEAITMLEVVKIKAITNQLKKDN